MLMFTILQLGTGEGLKNSDYEHSTIVAQVYRATTPRGRDIWCNGDCCQRKDCTVYGRNSTWLGCAGHGARAGG